MAHTRSEISMTGAFGQFALAEDIVRKGPFGATQVVRGMESPRKRLESNGQLTFLFGA